MDIQGRLWDHIAAQTRIEALQRVGARLGDEWTTLGRLEARLEWGMIPVGFELALAAAGLVILLWLVVQRGLWSGSALAVTVLTAQAVITIYGLGVDWSRYHLPILLLAVVCIGVLTGETWAGLNRLLGFRPNSPGAPHDLPPPPDSPADLHHS